ncbi:MAG: IucA/IucC family siderophore biosynthesis protein [Myxococcota bacterium]
MFDPPSPERHGAEHLQPGTWVRVTRAHIAKMLGEFAHERLIEPVPVGTAGTTPESYLVDADEGDVVYRFTATRWALDHWRVDPDSIERHQGGEPTPLDSPAFVMDFRASLGLAEDVLGPYLEELCAGLYADAYKWEYQRATAAQLAGASFQELEAAMTAGHPCFVANAGRLGFDVQDYRDYAPETGARLRLVWLAARRTRATLSTVSGLDEDGLYDHELGTTARRRLERALLDRGLDPSDYLLFPVHPWQWCNRLSITLAAEIARQDLVFVGQSEDLYQPQQSIRTMFNVSAPRRHYVKSALSIVNLGFVRGLSPYYMEGTPAINQWVHELVSRDITLQRFGFGVLRELAAIGYRVPTLERALPPSSHHNKMLASLWRESPFARIDGEARLLTMAALLHVDRDGDALLPHLIARSGHDAETWLRSYLRAYLSPLLHCFYAHRLVFMPHGENLILVLQDGLPTGVLLKDIAEEVALLGNGDHLPSAVRRIAIEVDESLHLLSIFTDVFDCFFRFLAPLAATHCDVPQGRFWGLVGATVREYQTQHPEHAARYEQFDLFAPAFRRSCLNRLQLRNAQQMIDLGDPAANLQFEGELVNPLAGTKIR